DRPTTLVSCPLRADRYRNSAPQRIDAECRLCSLIPGFGVKLSAIILAGPRAPEQCARGGSYTSAAHAPECQESLWTMVSRPSPLQLCDNGRLLGDMGLVFGNVPIGLCQMSLQQVSSFVIHTINIARRATVSRTAPVWPLVETMC